jgi:hypothetical protein
VGSVIEAGIRKSREQGGESLARMAETEVEGLERYKKTVETEPRLSFEGKPVELIGLGNNGLRMNDHQGTSFNLKWSDIVLISVATIKTASDQSDTGGEKIIIVDLFNQKSTREHESFYSALRIRSDQLPIERLFKNKIPVVKACMTIVAFIQEHVSSSSIPPEESIKSRKLPTYHSLEQYERSLGKKLTLLESETGA